MVVSHNHMGKTQKCTFWIPPPGKLIHSLVHSFTFFNSCLLNTSYLLDRVLGTGDQQWMSQVRLCPHGASIPRIILGHIYWGPVTLQYWNKDIACIGLLSSHLSPKRWGYYLSLRGRELQLAHFIPAISIGTGLGAWFQTSSPTSGCSPENTYGRAVWNHCSTKSCSLYHSLTDSSKNSQRAGQREQKPSQ